MKIETIESRHRRDFYAIYVCEHCGAKKRGSGYDDANFHANVVRKMECRQCGKTAGAEYDPRGTKYAPWEVVWP